MAEFQTNYDSECNGFAVRPFALDYEGAEGGQLEPRARLRLVWGLVVVLMRRASKINVLCTVVWSWVAP